MKFNLITIGALLTNIYCSNSSIDETLANNQDASLVEDFNIEQYFKSLQNVPNSFIDNITNLEVLNPPIKLETPTKVITPPPSEVKRHWYHAVAAYCYTNKFVIFTCDRGCVDYKIIKTFYDPLYGHKATIGVETSTKEIIIAHRGSQTIQNWLADFYFKKAKLPNTPEGVLVHEGFLITYKSVSVNINNYLMDMLNSGNYKDYKVIVTGQSLGAAVATVHAVDIANQVKSLGFDFTLFAYHSPRVGNQAFVNYAINQNFKIARYTNKGDLVSHLGPRKFDFVHLPGEFHTDFSDLTGRSFHECGQDYDEDPNCGWKEWTHVNVIDHGFGFGYPINRIC